MWEVKSETAISLYKGGWFSSDGERSETLEKNVTVTEGCSRRGAQRAGPSYKGDGLLRMGNRAKRWRKTGMQRKRAWRTGRLCKRDGPSWMGSGRKRFVLDATHIRRMPVARKWSGIAGSPTRKANAHSCGRFKPPRSYAQACAQGTWHSMHSCLKGDDGAFRPGQGLLGNSLLCGLHIPREFLTQRRRFANFPRNWRLSKLRFPFSNSL